MIHRKVPAYGFPVGKRRDQTPISQTSVSIITSIETLRMGISNTNVPIQLKNTSLCPGTSAFVFPQIRARILACSRITALALPVLPDESISAAGSSGDFAYLSFASVASVV